MDGPTPHSGSVSEMGSVPTPQTQNVAASTPIETTREGEPDLTPDASLQTDVQPSQFTLSEMYGECEKSARIFRKLKDLISKLYEQYCKWYSKPPQNSQDASMSSDTAAPSNIIEMSDSDSIVFEDPMSKWKQTQKIKLSELKKNEMDWYLKDEVAEDYNGFDILRWWKGKNLMYRVLSCMARDILAIPVSTVASKSVFSTGGRILDPYRGALSPTTVEALICTQNWLKSVKILIPLEEGDQAADLGMNGC